MRKSPRKRLVKETRTAYQATSQRSNRNNRFQRIICALRANDSDIIEIVQFGSSVYAPRLARDLDLMITTRAKKAEDTYWDAVEDWHKHVDLIIRKPGQRMGEDIALSVFTFSKTLFGNGVTRKEAKQFMPVPTYEQARKVLGMADRQIGHAHQEPDEFYRDGYYRAAFDFLFDAARYAAMTFLVTSETRWGKLREKLRKPFNTQFRDFISTLHVQYVYEDKFPRDQADEAFKEWRGKVSAFIDGLAARSQSAG